MTRRADRYDGRPALPVRPSRRGQAGLSIVEMMVSMAICLVLLAGMSHLVLETSRSRRDLETSSRQTENARYALARLAEDIRLAGFLGDFANPPTVGQAGFPAAVPADPCSTDLAVLLADMPVFMQGYDGASPAVALPACIATGDRLEGTDILVIRRAATRSLDVAAMAADTVYLQSSAVSAVLGTSASRNALVVTRPAGNGTLNVPAALRRYLVRIYYVSPCNRPASGTACTGAGDDDGSPVPTLKMLELGAGTGAPAFTRQAIAEGVQQLQFDYGVDADGDGAPDRYTTCGADTPCGANDWGNLVTVRVNVLARNAEPGAGYVDRKTYALGLAGTVGPFSDNYRRHAYSATIRVNNNSMRREQ